MKNSIAERVCDFLKIYPPFDLIKFKKLLEIAEEVVIVYLEKGDTLFKADQPANEYFYIVRAGAISLFHTENDTQELVTINDTGDIFGVRPLIARENYKLTLRQTRKLLFTPCLLKISKVLQRIMLRFTNTLLRLLQQMRTTLTLPKKIMPFLKITCLTHRKTL
ncbi:predicted signal-transduction protein containing cAMP-binding and CBS domains [Algibacter lectus]|uniref:Predicted signal-transduction protein containing cAMP-binding and CBS domains n=1 Tax=Algibacter lectus TaxID=221126 RepID=A0A090X144_9FLAO|nr:predicted signal-transduction protein containing cAMP-binding and CBS domains [Algibacter lectus]